MNAKDQLLSYNAAFKQAFGEEMLYNGQNVIGIHDEGETNKKEQYRAGRSDKAYFSLPLDVVPNPRTNDEITYQGEKYRVIRVTGKNAGFTEVEASANNSVFPRER